MGCHLSSPNKTKSFEENGSSRMKYIVASMQGISIIFLIVLNHFI